jgi:hypothetical protein
MPTGNLLACEPNGPRWIPGSQGAFVFLGADAAEGRGCGRRRVIITAAS